MFLRKTNLRSSILLSPLSIQSVPDAIALLAASCELLLPRTPADRKRSHSFRTVFTLQRNFLYIVSKKVHFWNLALTGWVPSTTRRSSYLSRKENGKPDIWRRGSNLISEALQPKTSLVARLSSVSRRNSIWHSPGNNLSRRYYCLSMRNSVTRIRLPSQLTRYQSVFHGIPGMW